MRVASPVSYFQKIQLSSAPLLSEHISAWISFLSSPRSVREVDDAAASRSRQDHRNRDRSIVRCRRRIDGQTDKVDPSRATSSISPEQYVREPRRRSLRESAGAAEKRKSRNSQGREACRDRYCADTSPILRRYFVPSVVVSSRALACSVTVNLYPGVGHERTRRIVRREDSSPTWLNRSDARRRFFTSRRSFRGKSPG